MKNFLHCPSAISMVFLTLLMLPLFFTTGTAQVAVPAQSLLGPGGEYGDGIISQSRKQRVLPVKPASTIPGPGDDLRNIMVKFRDDLRMYLGTAGYPEDRLGKGMRSIAAQSRMNAMAASGAGWMRMSGASEEETERLRETAERNLNREIGRLNNYFVLHVPPEADSREWIDALNALDGVEIALFCPKPMPLPVPGSYQSRQGYLNAATAGIDANYAWSSLGDSGQNVTICDFEYWWNLSHQDLPAGITTLIPAGLTPVGYSSGDTNHGTAVLGEMASRNNGWGTTGAAYGSTINVAHTLFSPNQWLIGTAILNAMTVLSPGDVLLIEHQLAGPAWPGSTQFGMIPVEWWFPWYEVIVTAVGNGFHVVEAGGNGSQNLDSSLYSTGNAGHWPFLPQNNSGAIIVGAGAVPSSFYGTDTARSRLSFSNYGSRVDLQGWGEFVVTTGYGTLHNTEGTNLWYDSVFAGTSSASPIVASAVALVESRFETVYGGTMAPVTLRSLLKITGTPQQAGTYPLSQNIGPLPNLNAALNFASHTLAGGTYQVGNSRTYVNLTQVSDTLRTKILTGNVVFTLMNDYFGATETYPIVFNQYSTGGGNWTVTIRPDVGVTARTTTGAPPPYMPLISLNGVDRITFDGRPGGTGSGDWLIRNSRTDSTAPAFLFTNGADDNTLEYLRIESQCTTLTYGTIAFGMGSDSLGNRRNRVEHNVISDRSDVPGLPHYAISSDTILSAPNDSNTILGNDISNWDITAVLLITGEHWTVDSNSFYQVMPQPNTLTAIQVNSGNGHYIRDNHIGGSTPGSVGAPLTLVGNVQFNGMMLTVDTLSKTYVERNVIRNIISTSSGFAPLIGIGCYGSGKLRIADNVIGDPVNGITLSGNGFVGGIDIASIQGAEVEGNTITNIRQFVNIAGQVRCIAINSPGIFLVKGNHVSLVGPTKPGASGLVSGICLDTWIDSALVVNNMIALGFGDSNDCGFYGIYDITNSGMIRVDVSHNSIAIGGISSGGVNSVGINHPGSSFITVKNNAVNNLRTGLSSFQYALYNFSPGWLPGMSDFNVLNNLYPASLASWMGTTVNFAGWQAMSAGDFASINADPRFISPGTGDLHIDPTVWSPVDNAATPLATVTDDFDGNVRGGAPDIGADEYVINFPAYFSFISPPNGSFNRPVSDTLRWHSSAAAIYDVHLDSVWPSGLVASNLTDTFYVYGPLDTNKTYYWLVYAKNSSGALTDPSYPWTFFTGSGSGLVSRSYPYDSSWNMLSVPLYLSDSSKVSIYPGATSNAFVYSGGYLVEDTLAVGMGFWIKFGDTGHTAMTGYTTDPETVDVSTGWNIIGSISDAVTTSSIASIPGGIVTSPFYGYSGGYFTADTINPGRSYWVKVSQNGKIVLTTDTAGMVPSSRIRIEPIAEPPPAPPDDGGSAEKPGILIPDAYGIDQNFPNPFNSTTAIRFRLPEESRVTIRIYDVLGREVATVLDRTEAAGEHVAYWNGGGDGRTEVVTGVYYCRIRAVSATDAGKVFLETRKLIMLK